MSIRVLLHVGFWLFFVTLDTLVSISFPGTSDLVYPPIQRFLRFLLNHLAFLPWQIIPFYALFYWLIPKYLSKRKYLHFAIYTILILLSCILVYRSLIKPMSWLLYQDMPDFNTFSARRLFYTFTEFLPALGLASTIKLIRGRMAAQQREQQLRNEKLASELNFLKAQTNPHFLFNTLNNLYGLARRQDNNTAPSIMKLSNIMRYILYECDAPFIPIYKEIKIIQDYIELEQLRYDERLEVNLDVQIDRKEQMIAPLLLIPFVENAFKHGASEARFDSKVDIQLHLSEAQLWFQVQNPNQSENKKDGIGLKNVQRQLELIYPGQYQLDIYPEEALFRIELYIQLEIHNGK